HQHARAGGHAARIGRRRPWRRRPRADHSRPVAATSPRRRDGRKRSNRMNPEVLEQLWNRVRKHLDYIMVNAFLLMTAVVIYFWMQEAGLPELPADTTPQQWNPPDLIITEPLMLDFLTTFSTPAPALADSPEAIIAIQNVWEYRQARDEEQLRQQAFNLHQQ